MSKAVLLDALSPGFSLGTGTIVTASARAEYHATLKGIAHQTLSDIASEAGLAAQEDDYWTRQVAWFAELEEWLVTASSTLQRSGLRPIIPAGYRLKALLDPVFVRAFESDALTRHGWTEIEHHVRLGGPGLLHDVLPEFCRSRGIGYTAIGASATRVTSKARTSPRAVVSSLGAAARFEGGIRRRAPRVPGGQDAAGLNLLLLSTFYDLTDLLARNRAQGGRIVIVQGNRLVELSGVRRRTIGVLDGATVGDRQEWRAVAEGLRSDVSLRRWPASWFDGAAAGLAIERLAAWFEHVMPEVIANARGFSDAFARESFDAVVAPYVAYPLEIGAFTAARAAGGPTSVQIEHGDTAHLAPSWDFGLRASDVVFAPSRELADYFDERVARYPERSTRTEVGSYRWLRSAGLPDRRPRFPVRSLIRGQSARRSSPASFDASKPVLVYLVTAMAGDHRYLNNAWYPDAWYFGLQRAIVDTLAGHERLNVIVKLFPGTTLDHAVIAEHVADLSAPHVMTSTAPFSRWLPWSDKVVADIASTGLYEALVARRPSLGLLWEHHVARPGAVEALGPALVPFATIPEAAAAVDRFASATAPALPELRPEGPDILTTLGELVDRRRQPTRV